MSAICPTAVPATLKVSARPSGARKSTVRRCSPVATTVASVINPATFQKNSGSASVKGTVRKQNEDRYSNYVDASAKAGAPFAIISVFDGHGGNAVSEWLTEKLDTLILEEWPENFCLEALSQACLKADFELIQPAPGPLGFFGERGVGGAKCGSTAVIATFFEEGGKTKLCTANVGDSRIILVRDGKSVQLSVDHVPDSEDERRRIDRGNPNLRKSLVSFTEGSWRVGGVLALSRAFGDAFLKESGRFEGIGERNADYGSGFGLNAEPDCYIETVTEADQWVVLCSDGLLANAERGGGGGLENEEIASFLAGQSADADPTDLAKQLCSMAVAKGSTDDVTVSLVRL